MIRALNRAALAALILFNALTCFAPPAQAQLLLLGVGSGAAGGSAPAGSVIAAAVQSDGWEVQVTLSATTCLGLMTAYAMTPDATAKVVFTVTSPGFDTSGNATTINRTVIGTISRRQAYPNGTLPTETQSGGSCIVTIALSDFINLHDTAKLTVASAWYTGAAATSNFAVTNNSTVAHPIPVGYWVTQPFQRISSGADYTVEAAFADARPLNASQIAYFKASLTDGTHTYNCSSSAMVELTDVDAVSGVPVYGYKCTFLAGTLTSLTAGNVTRDFTAYPWIGDNVLTASHGQDGVTISPGAHNSNLHAITDVYDTTGKYAPAYAWVSYPGNTECSGTTGTAGTSAAVSSSATDPGCGAGANFPDTVSAAVAIQSWMNANRSHSDGAGGIIYIRAHTSGTFNGWSTTTDFRTSVTAGATWLTVKASPGHGATDVVDSPQSSPCDATNACSDLPNMVWIESVGFKQVDATANQRNQLLFGPDGASTISEEQVCNLCTWTQTASTYPSIYQLALIRWQNTTFNIAATGGSAAPFTAYGGSIFASTFIGNVVSGAPIATPLFMHGGVIGNNFSGINIKPHSDTNFCLPMTGGLVAFNKVMNSQDPLEFRFSATPGCISAANFASLQNVYEAVNLTASGFNFLGDDDETPFTNFFQQYDTVWGNRENICYNEGTGPNGASVSTPKSCSTSWSTFDPSASASHGRNIKGDYYSAGPNGLRIGNFPTRFGVGSSGIVMGLDTLGRSVPSDDAFMGDYVGRTGSATANSEGYNQTVAVTTNNSTSGTATGGGNYKPTGGATSPAYGRVYSGTAGLPNDITGAARRNDGTGCAGAYEC